MDNKNIFEFFNTIPGVREMAKEFSEDYYYKLKLEEFISFVKEQIRPELPDDPIVMKAIDDVEYTLMEAYSQINQAMSSYLIGKIVEASDLISASKTSVAMIVPILLTCLTRTTKFDEYVKLYLGTQKANSKGK